MFLFATSYTCASVRRRKKKKKKSESETGEETNIRECQVGGWHSSDGHSPDRLPPSSSIIDGLPAGCVRAHRGRNTKVPFLSRESLREIDLLLLAT